MDALAEVYLRCHEIVAETVKESTGRYPREYKPLEKRKLDKYFRTLQYKGMNRLDFCSEMMSSLIVMHALPNTNHRTTLQFMRFVFSFMEIRFPSYALAGNKSRWVKECNWYIASSKRILTTRNESREYPEKHLEMTKHWLTEVVGYQSNSSGMMSRKSLMALRNNSKVWASSSVIVKKP